MKRYGSALCALALLAAIAGCGHSDDYVFGPGYPSPPISGTWQCAQQPSAVVTCNPSAPIVLCDSVQLELDQSGASLSGQYTCLDSGDTETWQGSFTSETAGMFHATDCDPLPLGCHEDSFSFLVSGPDAIETRNGTFEITTGPFAGVSCTITGSPIFSCVRQ